MNIDKINVNISSINNKNLNFKEGDIIQGYIKSLNNNVYTISLENNIYINLDKDKVIGNIGDLVYFSKDDKNILRQIISDEQLNINTLKVDDKQNNNKTLYDFSKIIKSQQKYKNFLEKNNSSSIQENILYSNKIKNKFVHLSNTVTNIDIQKFINKGVTPENLDIMSFDDYLNDSLGIDTEENTLDKKTLKEIKEEKQKSMKMDLNMNGIDEESIFRFENILSKVGLPSTHKNIASLQNIKQKLEDIGNIDNNVALNIIKKGNNATIEDLYTSKYTRFYNGESLNTNEITNLDEQIENILKQNNIEINEENIYIAKEFINNEIDLSFENVENFKKLQNINIDEILEKSAKNILKNENLLNIKLFNNQNIEDKYLKYKTILPNILPEHIQGLINNKIKINLKNITENYQNVNVDNINVTKDALDEKLNLYKIQLKLTSEAIYSLYNKDINIDTKPLKEVINYLENIQQQNYKKSLELNNVSTTQENIQVMQSVFSTMKNIYPFVVYNTFKDVIEQNVDFSLAGINKSLKAQNIIDDFETFKTIPNRAFGDNINKLKDNFKNLLIENGFEPNEINIKALKILSLNNMDFTEENMLNVKLLDNKIDYLANNLHPLTVSKMLKDNFNPMDKNIDDVIDYINNNSFGQTAREKIAEQILDIDNNNDLSKKERDAIISVYRMLNIVQKGDSIAIGNLLKTEKNITLENLLQASKIAEKSKKNIRFDEKVDNTIGEIEKIIPESNIVKSIKEGLNKTNEDYHKFILNQILDYSSPEKIINVDSNITIENLLESLKNTNKQTISEYTKENILKDIQNLENINGDVINYLIKNNIPITINNIQIMESILKQKLKLSKDIEDFKLELENRNINFGDSIFNINEDETFSKNKLINTVDNLKEENEKIFDDILYLNDLDDIKYMILKNKQVKSNISFIKDFNNIKNGIYTLPMKLSNGKITDLNMYILNDTSLDNKNLNMYLNFDNVENKPLQAYVKTSNNGSLAEIVTNTNSNIKNYEKDILNILSKFEIYPKNVTYSIDTEKDLHKEEDILYINEKFKNMDTNFNKVV